ncbi:hypothetical protein CYMTET_28895 [Cymbomonas tetramitiformis]|uniref:Right handed beta helix domain-containing protein n=1 Tax=Cymbomonas tetramitiformis TaxID=36881 RepID=A0AAE0KVS2_9CHLO|nr:hypothetical protein CYMTET_28895 [Cymbomonas tetramitiformis]
MVSQCGGVADIITSGDVSISECTISGNSASSNGGVAYIYEGSTVTITNSTITDNSAAIGGAVAIKRGFMEVRSSTFSKNRAQEGGGAIAATRQSSLFLHQDVIFEQNTAGSTGKAHLTRALLSGVHPCGARV